MPPVLTDKGAKIIFVDGRGTLHDGSGETIIFEIDEDLDLIMKQDL